MARPLDVALEEDPVVPESRLGLTLRCLYGGPELVRALDDAHPAPAAARRRFDHERVTDLVRRACRSDRDAGLAGDPLGSHLVPGRAQHLRRRADPGEPGLDDRLRKLRVLREEAVARMNSVGARGQGCADVLGRIEVALDLERLACPPRVERTGVVGRCHSHGVDPQSLARPEDADGDLAAIRYEELADRHAGSRFSRNARSPSWPSSPVRSRAARCATSGAGGASRTSRFASLTAVGPPARRSARTRSRAASRSAATSWTSPIRSAASA